MAWSLFPVEAEDDLTNWALWRELDDGISQRYEGVVGGVYPRSCTPFWIGTVGSITATGLTDADAEPGIWTIPGPCTGDKFFGLVCPEDVPLYYDVILSPEAAGCLTGRDPRRVIRAEITGNDEDGNLSFEDITIHKDVFKKINSFSDLAGKPYFVVPRFGGGEGYWWHERVQYPTGEIWRGTITDASAGLIEHASKTWGALSGFSDLSGKDIVFETAGGLKRAQISSNTSTSISITVNTGSSSSSGSPDVATGDFYIVPSGGVFNPNGGGGSPLRWYSGVTESWRSLTPTNTISQSRHPAQEVTWSQGPEDCEDVSHPALDVDLWSEFDETCSTKDKSYSPDFPMSIRGRQAILEHLTSQFIGNPPYNLSTISNASPAIFFHERGINSFSATDTSDAGNVEFSFSLPYSPIGVYYALIGPERELISQGYTELSGTFTTTVPTPAYDDQTITCIASFGWPRIAEKRVRNIYTRESFDPPVDEESGEPISPEDEDGLTGTWIEDGIDTLQMEYDDYGFPIFTDEIESGDWARYVGSNWHDGLFGFFTDSSGDYDSFLEYWKYAEFQLPSDLAAYRASKAGTASAGSTSRELKTDKSWWLGTLRTDSGTSTSTSATSLTDTSKSGSWFWDAGTGRWIGFIIEIEIDSVWHKRPITDFSGTTISWSEDLPSFTGSLSYRIYEPVKQKNRWRGRKLYITHETLSSSSSSGGGEPIEYGPFVITHSDNSSLFFADCGFEISEDDAWRIDEIEPGEIVECGGTEIYERIEDSKRDNPDMVARYGKARKGDSVTVDLLNSMYEFVDAMRRTAQDNGWSSREDPEVEELNQRFLATFGAPPGTDGCYDPDLCSEFRSFLDECWPDNDCANGPFDLELTEENNVPPIIRSGTSLQCDGISVVVLVHRYAYATVTHSSCFDRTVEIFLLGDTVNGFPDGVQFGNDCETGSNGFIEHFDGNATGWEYLEWHSLWSGSLPAGETDIRVKVCGPNTVQPNWGPCPPTPAECTEFPFVAASTGTNGFSVRDSVAVILHHFPNMTEEE